MGRYSNLHPSTVVSVAATSSSKMLGTYSTDNTVFEHTLYLLTILHIPSFGSNTEASYRFSTRHRRAQIRVACLNWLKWRIVAIAELSWKYLVNYAPIIDQRKTRAHLPIVRHERRSDYTFFRIKVIQDCVISMKLIRCCIIL